MQGQQSKPSNQKYPYFEESSSAEVVNARISDNADPRLREVMTILVKHLHAAIKEIEPTHEEWLTAINFLTETGHMCTQWRQEYILLSDVLGVSMLVDAINHRRPSGATENTILGHFMYPTRHDTKTVQISVWTRRATLWLLKVDSSTQVENPFPGL